MHAQRAYGFQELNAAILRQIRIPVYLCRQRFHRTEILDAFRVRVNHHRDEEFKTAIEQVHRIARLRLETIADEN